MGKTVFRFAFTREEWLTSNNKSRHHWAKTALIVKALRHRGYIIGLSYLDAYHIKLGRRKTGVWSSERPCRVTAVIHLPTRRRFDASNAEPTVKALVDGLVDARWFTDDSSDIIRSWTYERGELSGRPGIYRVDIIVEDDLERTHT